MTHNTVSGPHGTFRVVRYDTNYYIQKRIGTRWLSIEYGGPFVTKSVAMRQAQWCATYGE